MISNKKSLASSFQTSGVEVSTNYIDPRADPTNKRSD